MVVVCCLLHGTCLVLLDVVCCVLVDGVRGASRGGGCYVCCSSLVVLMHGVACVFVCCLFGVWCLVCGACCCYVVLFACRCVYLMLVCVVVVVVRIRVDRRRVVCCFCLFVV